MIPRAAEGALEPNTANDREAGASIGRRAALHNLPTRSSFLGRVDEMREVASLLASDRLVTLTGPPGIGKSRLALQLAGRTVSDYPDGAWLVELAPISDPAGVPDAVASVLGVPEVPGQRLTATLAARLVGRRLLLVLDNCEHLLGACGGLAELLLHACPGLSILATSQEPLGIDGERAWPVPPLRVPEPAPAAPPEALMEYEAVRLFVERASDLQPDFVLNAYVAPHVIEICRRLDGIALAIELAAARIESLTPAEIAGRLDDRYSLLSKGSTSPLPRHGTLAAALDWSHDLLSEPERVLLRRLGVFVGGFCSEAAEAICGGGELAGEDVSSLLSRLASKSLVVSDGSSPVRYRPLETIRAYAVERLEEADETAELRAAHARFYLALAERAEPQLTGLDQQWMLERLDAERQNLRSALEWSLSRGDAASALRLAGALVLYWRVRCHFSEGRDLLEAVLTAADGAPASARAKVLWGAGFLALMTGDAEGAVPRLEESLSLFRELDDLGGCARALLVLGNCKQYANDADGLPLLEQSAALARTAGDSWCLGHALAVMGFDLGARNELPAARRLFEDCLAVARKAHDKQSLRMGLIGLGSVAGRQGDHGLAETLLEEGAAVSGELGEDYSKATALQYLAQIVTGRGDYARASELLEEALAILREVGPPNAPIDTLVFLGQLAHARGDRDGARGRFEEAAALGRAGGVTPSACLQGLADLAAEDDPVQARRLYEQALESARASADRGATAKALHGLAHLARSRGDEKRAAALHGEALHIQRQIGSVPGIAASLQAVAGLEAEAGRYEHAARLIGAARVLGNAQARPLWETSRYEADFSLLEERLSSLELAAALEEGAKLTAEEAAAQASNRGGRRKRPSSGWSSLTDAERRVAALVGQGLTNREIAERLFVAPGTVKTHLSHIFSKLNLTGRRDLREEVRTREEDLLEGD